MHTEMRNCGSRNIPCNYRVIVISLALAAGGCNHFLSNFAGRAPSVRGRWTGRLVSVTLTDTGGHPFEAAALAVEKRPALPKQYRAWEHTEAARVPLLVRTRTKPLLIVDPGRLPIGSRVEVAGTLLMETPNAPLRSGVRGGGIPLDRTTPSGERASGGPLIMLPAEGTAAIRAKGVR